MTQSSEDKPQRLNFETYLQMLHNSPGTNMFRNFYLQTPEQGKFDGLKDGELSCAFFVSSVLKIFDKVSRIHGLVSSTVEDLKQSSWQIADDIKPGDVLVWEPQMFKEGLVPHIGFALSGNQAVSTSYKKLCVIKHDLYFGEQNRKIEQVFRMLSWEDDA